MRTLAQFRGAVRMADVTPWIPVLSTVLVGVFTLLGVLLPHWMTTGRERHAREREARENRERPWSDFQIKALLDLQIRFLRMSDTLANVVAATQEYELTGHTREPGLRMSTNARLFYI